MNTPLSYVGQIQDLAKENKRLREDAEELCQHLNGYGYDLYRRIKDETKKGELK